MVRVVVLGAGMVGLATAVNVQEALPWARVTIVADKFDRDTTSSGAGGIFEPTAQAFSDQPVDTLREWSQHSWNYFTGLAMSPLGHETGQTLVSGYMLSDNRELIENPVYADIVFNFRVLRPEELRRLNFPCKYGNTYTTVITQPNKFMPWLMRKFKEQGGTVERRTVGSLEEFINGAPYSPNRLWGKGKGKFAGAYDIVMNCSGLRAGELAKDSSIFPIKGQMVQIKAPWIKTFVYCADKKRPTYFIPHDDKVWVGGTRDEGDYSTHLCPEIEEDILKRAGAVVPQIKAGEIVGRWAGLRPQRSCVRLEKELLIINGKKLRVVHNYGHGANGISLSWGTSLQAARLATEWANDISRSARL